MNEVKYLIVHHTGGTDSNPLADSSNQTFKIVDDYHKERFKFISSMGHYIGYHYFIEKDGTLTQGRSDDEEGAHAVGYNKQSLGICLAGNFDATLPSDAQIRVLRDLLKKKMKDYGVPLKNIVPHRTFANKTCYGRKLPDDWAQSILVLSREEKLAKANTLLIEAMSLLKDL